MKYFFAASVVALLFVSATDVQAQGDTSQPTTSQQVVLATGNEAKHAREADARHCLDLKSDRDIIRCAEPYRYRGTVQR